MFSPFSLAEPRHLKPWRVDASTLQFLTAIPEVQVRPLPDAFYEVVIPAGVLAMWTTSDEGNGSDTWLYRFPSGQVLGHDTEGVTRPLPKGSGLRLALNQETDDPGSLKLTHQDG
jgi:hypothetical protein